MFSTKFDDLGVIVKKRCSIQQGGYKIAADQSKVLENLLYRLFSFFRDHLVHVYWPYRIVHFMTTGQNAFIGPPCIVTTAIVAQHVLF